MAEGESLFADLLASRSALRSFSEVGYFGVAEKGGRPHCAILRKQGIKYVSSLNALIEDSKYYNLSNY